MSKGIRWEIPFVSLLGKRYVVEIYDEQGDWSGVTTLIGGPSPFCTEEDSDPDLFTPMRSQSATIQICTETPNGGKLNLDDIMPYNNTDRPVKLCRIDNNTRNVEWMGFLSCELYSQDYVDIPDIVSISAIGILVAMGSVECNIDRLYGTQSVANILGYLFGEIGILYGSSFGNIYISGEGKDFLYKFINTSIFYSTKEIVNGDTREEYIKGVSLQEALTTITQYIGWCAREQGNNIYLQTMLSDHRMIQTTISQLVEDRPIFSTFVDTSIESISDLVWRGIGHQRSMFAGKKSVEVVANMKKFTIDVGIPDFPNSDYITAENNVTIDDGGKSITAAVYISKNLKAYTRCDLQIFNIDDLSYPPYFNFILTNDVNSLYENSYYNSLIRRDGIAGAALIRLLNRQEDYDNQGVFVKGEYRNGTLVNVVKESDYVVKLRSISHLCAYNGQMTIHFDGIFWNGAIIPNGYYISVAVKWGEKYLNADLKTWSNGFTYFSLYKQDDPIVINITEYNYGEVSILVMPFSVRNDQESYDEYQYIITELSITYNAPEGTFDSTDSNTYFEHLRTTFKDDKSIDLDLASSFRSNPSPSLILNVDPYRYYDPLVTMMFYAGEKIEERPEVLLLNNMVNYYRIPRSSLKLEVEMPSTSLPLLQLKGINDSKVYIPVASTRDWITDVSQLYCSETNPWLVIKSDGQLWARDSSLIIHRYGGSVTLNFTSPFDLTWKCRVSGELQDVYINGSAGSGTISAGVDVPVVFLLGEEENENGWVDFYQNGKLVASLYIVAEY